MSTASISSCGLFTWGCLAVVLAGCSGSDSSGPGTVGGTNGAGAPGIGGLVSTGGITGSGGASSTAGALSVGGNSGIGGSTAATGGAAATGGVTSVSANTGGMNSTGGTPSLGGSASGGTVATGGSKAAGGSNSTGGAIAAGGTTPMGGASSIGGTTAVGGTTSTGGSKAAGGTVATGGSATTGGIKATGGTAATGGKATGGAATGGAATGGSGASNCNTPPAPSDLVGWAAVSGKGVTTTTGGGNATPQTVTTLAALNSAAAGTGSAVIYVTGVLASGTVNIGSNKTIVGLCGAELHGTVNINGSSNVIVRNIRIVGNNCSDSPTDCSNGADAVHVSAQAHHIWFDHDEILDGSDGNFDINQASDFVTISWTKFRYSTARTDPANGGGHRYSNLIGSADNTASDVGFLNTTFHHNWWGDNVDQRMPRVRYGKIHVYNNLYTTTGNNYCVGVGADASVRVENNVFIGVTRPVNSASSGFANANTTLTIAGNIYTNTNGANATDIGVAFTPTYPFTMDAASAVEAAVRSGAGPQ